MPEPDPTPVPTTIDRARLATSASQRSGPSVLEYPLPYSDDPVLAVANYEKNTSFSFAADGALLKDYGDRYDGAGVQLSPVAASQYCYAAHSAWLATEDQAYADRVIQQATALLGRAVDLGAGPVWTYDFPQQTFSAEPGWISGMAQGLVAACMTLAADLTGDEKFTDGARAALRAMAAPMEDGGTSTDVPGDAGVFYEEVAAPGIPSSRILNGMVYALAGAELHLEANGADEEVESIVERGLAGLEASVADYFVPGMTLYDLGPERAARLIADYNTVHAYQLLWLGHRRGQFDLVDRAYDAMRNETISMMQPTFELLEGEVIEGRGLENIAGIRSYFAGVRGQTLRLRMTTDIPFREVAAYGYTDETSPAAMTVNGVESKIVRRTLVASLDESVTSVEITLEPQDGKPVALFHLVPLADPEAVPLDVLASDLTSYRGGGVNKNTLTQPRRSPMNVLDGDAETSWSTDHSTSWLMVRVADRTATGLTVGLCDESTEPVVSQLDEAYGELSSRVAFGDGSVTLDGEARHVLLEFTGDACVTVVDVVRG